MKMQNKIELSFKDLDIETLTEALFYRGEFLSVASHELKNFLTMTWLQVQVFKRTSKKETAEADLQAPRMMKLIEDMLEKGSTFSLDFKLKEVA